MSSKPTSNGRRLVWLFPTALAAIAATRFPPIAAPAMLLLLCYLPGRIGVQAAGLAASWDTAGRVVLSVALSLAVAPVLLNALWHLGNTPWLLLTSIWLTVSVGLWLAERRFPETPASFAPTLRLFDEGFTCIIAAALAILVTFVTVGPYWPTELHGYPVPSLIHDFVKHHAVLFSLERRPLPLGDPFYADGAAGPVYYYHFFYLIPATVRAVAGGPDIELAFGIQSALVAIVTAAMFYLTVKRFTRGDRPAILGALLATVIGGLDIIPVLCMRQPVVTLDAWADHTVRIHNFLTQMIWSPQNISGVLMALVGVYILSLKGWWKGWFVMGPLLIAAIVGSSVWVALVVLAGTVVFVLLDLVPAGGPPISAVRRALGAAGVAVPALVLSAPSLLGYAEMSRRLGKGLTTLWPHQSHALLGRLVQPGILANLLDLPWLLALELGPLVLFPLLLPGTIWKRAWRDRGLRLLLICGIVAIAGFVTFRSHFTYNDFGQKTMLVAMTAGVVLASCVVSPHKTKASLRNPFGWSLQTGLRGRGHALTAWLVGLVLLAGLPVGLYEAPLTAVRRYLPANGPLKRLLPPGALRTIPEGAAYRFLRYDLPSDAVLQADWGGERVNLVQIARKQVGVTILQEDTQVFAPAHPLAHEQCLTEVSVSLSNPGTAAACHAVLRRHGITHVFIGTIEHQRWGELGKFDDSRYFDPVFRDGDIRVFALK